MVPPKPNMDKNSGSSKVKIEKIVIANDALRAQAN